MMRKQYLLFILLFVFTGCKTTQKTSQKVVERTYENPALLDKMWAVTQINGSELQYSNQADVAYLLFDKNLTVKGCGGCNNYSGRYDVKGDSIVMERVGATMRLCPDQEIEDAFFKAMNEVVTFKVTKDNLKLYDKRKKEVINAMIIKE